MYNQTVYESTGGIFSAVKAKEIEMEGRDLALLTDLYELTMMQGYFETGSYKKQVVFDLFYRKNPSGNGYAIAAGLQQVIEYIRNLRFTEDDIAYLKVWDCFPQTSLII